jgi:hypothetical protein
LQRDAARRPRLDACASDPEKRPARVAARWKVPKGRWDRRRSLRTRSVYNCNNGAAASTTGDLVELRRATIVVILLSPGFHMLWENPSRADNAFMESFVVAPATCDPGSARSD